MLRPLVPVAAMPVFECQSLAITQRIRAELLQEVRNTGFGAELPCDDRPAVQVQTDWRLASPQVFAISTISDFILSSSLCTKR